jgi:hypothetical protein
MTPRSALGSLRDNNVRARLGRALRFVECVGLMHVQSAPGVDALGEPAQVVLGSTPGGGDHARTRREHGVNLIVVHREQEQVQSERTVRPRADAVDRGPDLVGRHRADAQRTEATRLTHGRHEVRSRRASHAPEHDRMTNAKQLSQSCLDHRRSPRAER